MGHQFPSEFYTKTNWKNEPDTSTPLGQANLNHIEQGIKTADERIYNLDGRIGVYEDYETEISAQVQQAKDYSEASEDSATDSASSATQSSGYANSSALSATQSQNYSRDSEAWAKGTRNGTAVPSTDETYENNSKYYAEQAQHIVDDFTINNETPTFTQASTRTNINSGETISTIMGKIKKFFADLKTVAFTGSYNDLLNKPEHLGHSIKDATTTFTDRASLKFTGNVSVSDDSTNDATIIDVEGKPDHFYATKEDMLDDIANIGEGEMAYTGEDASDLLTRVENLEKSVKSHVGMIIHSTTLDTMAKVIEIYGGTNWIQHSGYVLRGATAGVVANQASKDGGSDNAVVVNHSHSIPSLSGTAASNGDHTHWSYSYQSTVNVVGGGTDVNFHAINTSNTGNVAVPTSSAGAHTHSVATNASTTGSKGEDGTNKNIPAYKSIYIWERTA